MAEAEIINSTSITRDAANKTLIMERLFPAGRERVWQAWADAEQFKQWWGPRGWETTVKNVDFRNGGSMLYGMKCVDESQGEWFGQESWGKMEFISITEPESIEYKDLFCDEDGNVSAEMPVMVNTVEFIEQDGGTLVRSTGVFETETGYQTVINMGVVEGASQTWDRLAEVLAEAN